ncbi:MAG: hypothetical protein WCL04_03930 [Verrucomicrobiota bacterium]
MNPQLEAIRHRIEHEDNLVNQRLSWLVGSQSFLLTAFAILLNGPQQLRLPHYAGIYSAMVGLLPWVGLGCVAVLWLTLWGAIWSMKKLRDEAAKVMQPGDMPVHSIAAIRMLGLAAPVVIPALFLMLWIVVVCAA